MFEGVVSYPKLTDKWLSCSLSQPYHNKDNSVTWTNIKCMLPASRFSFIEDKMRILVKGRISNQEYQGKTYYTLWGEDCVVVQKKQPDGAQGPSNEQRLAPTNGDLKVKSSKSPFPKASNPTGVNPVKNDAIIGDEPIPF